MELNLIEKKAIRLVAFSSQEEINVNRTTIMIMQTLGRKLWTILHRQISVQRGLIQLWYEAYQAFPVEKDNKLEQPVTDDMYTTMCYDIKDMRLRNKKKDFELDDEDYEYVAEINLWLITHNN